MEENTNNKIENPKTNGKKMDNATEVMRDEKGRIVAGVLNPNGRPVGSKDYKAIFRDAIDVIAKQQGKKPEEIETDLYRSGILNAIKGNSAIYKDVMDRLHGKVTAPVDMNVKGDVEIKGAREVAESMRALLQNGNQSNTKERD